MITSIGIFLTIAWLLIATRPIVTLSQGLYESYWSARMNGLSMQLPKRLGAYLLLVLACLAVATAATWVGLFTFMPATAR